MRLHLWRPTADHLFTEEGEPQPVSSCRADGRGSRSLARRLFFSALFWAPRCGARGDSSTPSTESTGARLLERGRGYSRERRTHPQHHPPPRGSTGQKAGPAEPPAGPASCNGPLTYGASSSTGLGKISLSRSAQLGSFLTFHGQLPSGESGTVTVEGAYRRPPWQLLAAVPAQGGSYVARIHLTRAGLLHVRLTYPDGHRSVGSIRVVR
jgi:hypothetical protein